MVMYVPQATPLERGPTGVIPGSHYQMQRPDETVMPEVAGCLQAGGFLLIHYDIWHRKMKNFTNDKRFMMKFEFIRMSDPVEPTWDHADPAWQLTDLPDVDLSAVWRRQWDWLRGTRSADTSAELASDVAAQLADPDPRRRLAAISSVARNADAARTFVPQLASALHDEFEPIAINAAYTMTTAGVYALPYLVDVMARDRGDDPDGNRSSHDGSQPDPGRASRSAAYGLVELGAASVPESLRLLVEGGSHVRKLAAFVLGEITGTAPEVTEALCRAAADPVASVRINAVEALGLKRATPLSVATLSAAMKDPDPQVRFSAAWSLAQIGPDAAAAVPLLRDALKDENRYVPGYAVEALERIATPEAMRAVLPFLKSSRWCPRTSPHSIY
jgi:hypothetical protein